MSQPLTEKYRPKTLDEICGNKEVIRCLKTFIPATLPNMLFYGPPGTGKTTAIRALLASHPKEYILELNASDDRGIETVRHSIKSFASAYSTTIRVVILDEADSMSRDAQNALRRIMEDFPSTRFCLICNYAQKIIPPIASRCTRFRFSPVISEKRIIEICEKEGIKHDGEGVKMMVKYSDGDMRRVMNDLQGIMGSYESVTRKSVLGFYDMLNEQHFEEIYKLLTGDASFDICLRRIKADTVGTDSIGILYGLSSLLMKSPLPQRFEISQELAEIEYRLHAGCSDPVQLHAIISAFLRHR